MKFRSKHLRHPILAARMAMRLVAGYLDRAILAYRGAWRFRKDPRYSGQTVWKGFAPRTSHASGDNALFERICAAYASAMEHQHTALEVYGPTQWWENLRQSALRPAMQALSTQNLDALRGMYGNFFRDNCSAGLVGRPCGLPFEKFCRAASSIHWRAYLADELFRLEYWARQTESRCSLHELAGPEIGNPFGIWLDDVLVQTSSAYQHYCAWKISHLLNGGRAVVAEIGGGFGGMAYYLLRGRKDITYINFDLPESLALATYYLAKAFPEMQLLLYGEDKQGVCPDIIMMPVTELDKMPADCADVTFCSHVMSDLPEVAAGVYLNNVSRMTRYAFLCVMENRVANIAAPRDFQIAEKVPAYWNSRGERIASEMEYLFLRKKPT